MAAALASASASAAATLCKGERHALVIGNRTYPDSDAPLAGSVEGAHKVADALRAVGFEVQTGVDLTKTATEEAVRALQAKIKPGSAVFLYFSGYGVQSGGHTFLLPVDASIWSEADIATNGLNVDRVLAEIEDKKAAVEVVVLDGARRNPFERRFRAGGSAGLAPPSASSGNLVALYSAAPDKVFDAADLAGEAFATDVAREISAPHATAQEAFRQVRTLVARTSHAGQVPWGFTTLSDDLPLDIRDCSAAPGKGGPAPRPQTSELTPPPPAKEPPEAPPPRKAPPRVAAPPVDAAPKPAQTGRFDPPTPPQPLNVPRRPDEQAMIGRPPQPASPADDKARRFQIVLQDEALLDETRERLFEQGLEPGAVGSETMREAIRVFEQQAGLPEVGRPTLGLLDALRTAPSLSPWGAITVASDGTGRPQSWGMSWDKPTRAQALAEAKAKCKSSRCNQNVTFHSQDCGAFAMSPRQWNVSFQIGGDAARKAALGNCSKGGIACKVIGSVCADGSDLAN